MNDTPGLSHDIDSEIADHIERRAADLRREGISDAEARAQAAREFGDQAQARRQLLRIDARIERRRRPRTWTGIGADIRTAARRLRGQPGATALTTLTLALAIGAAAAVFSIVDQLILRPPPFIHADRLVDVWSQRGPGETGGRPLRAQQIVSWQKQPAVFERLEGYVGATFDLTESVEPRRLSARVVSLGMFDMLGIPMHIGRPFAKGDGLPGGEKVVILSHEFWRARFGGSPDALGARLVLNDEPYTIVGVLRRGTTLINDDEPIWLPFDLEAWGAGAPHQPFLGIGRLNKALDPRRAEAFADSMAVELDKSSPIPGTWHLTLLPKPSAMLTDAAEQTLFFLLGGVTLLLLTASVNVTSFSLGQAQRRARELRLCAALGASRWRLFRESLVETLLLAVTAGIGGALVAEAALGVLIAAVPEGLASMTTRAVEIDGRVLAVMTVATLAAGLGAGLLPGLRSSRLDLSSALGAGTRGSARGLSFRSGAGALVVIEVALAMMLLVGVALMSRTLIAFHAIDPGFDVDKLVTAKIALPGHRYPTDQARRDFFDALDAALRRQPGIEASTYAWGLPPDAGWGTGTLEAEGREPISGEIEYFANAVSPTYFETTGTALTAGRAFTPADAHGQVILSESFARLLWGDSPAVGRRMRSSADEPWNTVVGVARDVEVRWETHQAFNLQSYHPLVMPPGVDLKPVAGRADRPYQSQLLIVRSSNPALVPAAVREQVRALDPLQPVGTISSGAVIYAEAFAQQRFLLIVMGALAGMALLLAAMGIFGVLSQAVIQRRREIGIRVALGAGHARLIRMLVGRGILLAAIGAALGTAASLAGVKTLESLLFGVSAFDVASFASVIGLLLLVALIACWWPTRRALAVEPAEVLRSE